MVFPCWSPPHAISFTQLSSSNEHPEDNWQNSRGVQSPTKEKVQLVVGSDCAQAGGGGRGAGGGGLGEAEGSVRASS